MCTRSGILTKPVSSFVTWTESNNPTSCLLLLPGRSGDAASMVRNYRHLLLHETLLVSVTPENEEWYPVPNGPNDQNNAVAGLEPACDAIDLVLKKINQEFGLNKIGILGFSAGAVMALYCAAYLPYKFPVIVSHAGAILEPNKFPLCSVEKSNIPIVLVHNRDDSVFSWEERYKPMRKCLKQNGYKVTTAEKSWGGHGASMADLIIMSRFISRHFEYKGRFGKKFGENENKAFQQFVFG